MAYNKYIDLFALNQVSHNTAMVYQLELFRFFNSIQNEHSSIQIQDIIQYRNNLIIIKVGYLT